MWFNFRRERCENWCEDTLLLTKLNFIDTSIECQVWEWFG
jgi:hypothetical protein